MGDDPKNNSAPLRRLSALAALDAVAISALQEACDHAILVEANHRLPSRFEAEPVLIVSGWAARTRMIASGRRVIVSLALPGELVRPIDAAGYPLSALTALQVVAAPNAALSQPLARAYLRNYQLTESYLMAHNARLGLLESRDRLLDFTAEILERMLLSEDSASIVLDMPLTQWQVGEALGLTAVHVNRMAQLLKREGVLNFKRGPIHVSPDSEIGRHVRRNIAAIKESDRFPQRLPFEPATLDQRRTASRQRQSGIKIA